MKYLNPPKSNYTIISSDIFNELTPDEFTVYCYLVYISRIPNWEYQHSDLQQKLNIGRDKRQKILASLVKKGWLKLEFDYSSGKGKQVDYIVVGDKKNLSVQGLPEKQDTEKQDTGLQDTGLQDTAFQALIINNNINKELKKENNAHAHEEKKSTIEKEKKEEVFLDSSNLSHIEEEKEVNDYSYQPTTKSENKGQEIANPETFSLISKSKNSIINSEAQNFNPLSPCSTYNGLSRVQRKVWEWLPDGLWKVNGKLDVDFQDWLAKDWQVKYANPDFHEMKARVLGHFKNHEDGLFNLEKEYERYQGYLKKQQLEQNVTVKQEISEETKKCQLAIIRLTKKYLNRGFKPEHFNQQYELSGLGIDEFVEKYIQENLTT